MHEGYLFLLLKSINQRGVKNLKLSYCALLRKVILARKLKPFVASLSAFTSRKPWKEILIRKLFYLPFLEEPGRATFARYAHPSLLHAKPAAARPASPRRSFVAALWKLSIVIILV
jgi:hypothetical protein